MSNSIKAGIYFPPCPNTRNRKIIKAWEAEKTQFDVYIENINAAMAACDSVTDSLIEELFSDAELAVLNLKGSFNFHVKRLMPNYALSDHAVKLINDLMGCKYFQLKDIHQLIMAMKHDAIIAKEVKRLDSILEKLPQWRLEDSVHGEKNKWWTKKNHKSIDIVTVTKIMRGLEAGTEKFCRISADFNCKTGEQISDDCFVTSANLLDLL